MAEKGESSEAADLFQVYIAINRKLQRMSNARLHSCKEDRAQLNMVIDDLLKDKNLTENLGSFVFKPLEVSNNAPKKGALLRNYRSMVKFFRAECKDAGLERVRDIYANLLNKITVVQIDIRDPASGPAIFDSLNSRQEPMTVGDLVRNGIFSKVSNLTPNEIEDIDAHHWQPFYNGFEFKNKNYFDSFFFPFGLIKNSNLRKSEIFAYLQKEWAVQDDPTVIISDLLQYQTVFMDIHSGRNHSGFPSTYSLSLRRFSQMGVPATILPFVMRLSRALLDDEVSEANSVDALTAVESFLVRRSVVGVEPTGLHAVFKRLWNDIQENVSANSIVKKISGHKTVFWPNDIDFRNAIRTRKIYGTGITPYILQEYNMSLGGDQPQLQPHIEHVLPQKLTDAWQKKFSKTEHEQLVDTLCNLIPLSGAMNSSVGVREYSHKREIYLRDSSFKAARQFAEDNLIWDSAQAKKRSEVLADWALERWPISPKP